MAEERLKGIKEEWRLRGIDFIRFRRIPVEEFEKSLDVVLKKKEEARERLRVAVTTLDRMEALADLRRLTRMERNLRRLIAWKHYGPFYRGR